VPPYVTFARVDNGAPWQVVDPFLGVASNLGLADWEFALAAFTPSGVAREVFPESGGQRYMMVRRNAQMLNYSASAAWKFHDLFGVGVSLQWITVPTLDYSLIIDADPSAHPVASPLDVKANVSGSDLFTLNAVVGAWFRVAPYLELGASGQILPSEIRTKSKLRATPVNGTEPVLLTRDNVPADDVTLSLPLPLRARLGARYIYERGGRELFDVELDGVYESWSRVKRFRLNGNGLVGSYRSQKLDIDTIDIDKRWQDTLGIHLGGDYAFLPGRATVRAGAYYETAVAKPAYSNVDFADGATLGAALGGSLFFGKVEIAAAYEYRVQPRVVVSDKDARVYQAAPGSGCHPPYTDTLDCSAAYLGQPSPQINGGSYTSYSHIASLEGIYRF
jgi:long-subunit fatty acid transport protein